MDDKPVYSLQVCQGRGIEFNSAQGLWILNWV